MTPEEPSRFTIVSAGSSSFKKLVLDLKSLGLLFRVAPGTPRDLGESQLRTSSSRAPGASSRLVSSCLGAGGGEDVCWALRSVANEKLVSKRIGRLQGRRASGGFFRWFHVSPSVSLPLVPRKGNPAPIPELWVVGRGGCTCVCLDV